MNHLNQKNLNKTGKSTQMRPDGTALHSNEKSPPNGHTSSIAATTTALEMNGQKAVLDPPPAPLPQNSRLRHSKHITNNWPLIVQIAEVQREKERARERGKK